MMVDRNLPPIGPHAAKDEMWQRMRPWALVAQAAYEEHQLCMKPVCAVCDALRAAYRVSERPWCETCGTDAHEVLCPSCAMWWAENAQASR